MDAALRSSVQGTSRRKYPSLNGATRSLALLSAQRCTNPRCSSEALPCSTTLFQIISSHVPFFYIKTPKLSSPFTFFLNQRRPSPGAFAEPMPSRHIPPSHPHDVQKNKVTFVLIVQCTTMIQYLRHARDTTIIALRTVRPVGPPASR